MELTAHATRSGDWWAVEVPQVPGLYTQARQLEEIPAMVVDAASSLVGDDAAAYDVTVVASA